MSVLTNLCVNVGGWQSDYQTSQQADVDSIVF